MHLSFETTAPQPPGKCGDLTWPKWGINNVLLGCCGKRYIDIVDKYRKLFQKYQYSIFFEYRKYRKNIESFIEIISR